MEEVYSIERILEMRDHAREIYDDEEVMFAMAWALTQEQRLAFIEVLRTQADMEAKH